MRTDETARPDRANSADSLTPRRLLSVGASAANVFGVDYQHEFLDLGFRIFGDREKLTSCFVEGNLLQEQQTRELIKHARGDSA